MKKTIFVLLSVMVFGCGDFSSNDVGPTFGGEGVSTGGSLARFTIVGDYLYVVNDVSLIPIDITQLNMPKVLDQIELGVNIETIFPYGDNLFVGSASAVYIFSIADPDNPELLSTYWHSTGCDPVVVRGNYAYVTLREGESCGNFFDINVLEVVDITNLRNPVQVNSFNMVNPGGLGIGCGNKLYVCEGETGFVQFDITDPANPVEEIRYQDHFANDVIVNDSLVIFTGNDGIYQYSCSSDTLRLLSKLPISL